MQLGSATLITNQSLIRMPLPPLLPDGLNVAYAKRERRKDARPGELLEAALDLFVEKGYAATRAEEVALRAGVSKGTLFLYFSTKEELFKAVVRHNISGHYPAWHEALKAFTGSTADMLKFCLQSWWTSVGSTRASGISKLMMSEGAHFPDLADFYRAEVIEPGQKIILGILKRGVDSGEFRAMDMKYAVYSVLSPMLFLVTWKHSKGTAVIPRAQFEPEVFLAEQIETLLNGICLPQATPPATKASNNSNTLSKGKT